MGRKATPHSVIVLESIVSRLTEGIREMREHLFDLPRLSRDQRTIIKGILDIGRAALRDANFKRAAALAEMDVSGFATIAKQDRDAAFEARKVGAVEYKSPHKYQSQVYDVTGFGNVGTARVAPPTAKRRFTGAYRGYITHPWRGGRRR